MSNPKPPSYRGYRAIAHHALAAIGGAPEHLCDDPPEEAWVRERIKSQTKRDWVLLLFDRNHYQGLMNLATHLMEREFNQLDEINHDIRNMITGPPDKKKGATQ